MEPVTVVQQTSLFGLYAVLGLALFAAVQAIVTIGLNGWMRSREAKAKASQDIEAAKAAAILKSEEAIAAAELRTKEKNEEWARQDLVADRAAEAAQKVENVARQAAEAAQLLLEQQKKASARQDEVADLVATAARQAASAAELLAKSQEAAVIRQDQVAALVATAAKQASDAAELLRKAQEETIHRTDEVAKAAAASDERVQKQLIAIDEQGRKIHVLVNSDMTAARTAERDSLKLLVLALKQLKLIGGKPDQAADDEIDRVSKRVWELDQVLADRHAAQLIVEAEAAASGTSAAALTKQGQSPVAASRDSDVQPRVGVAAIAAESALKEIAKTSAETADNTAKIAAKE